MTSTPTRPVDNVVIATKGLQDRNINLIAGTTVENKGKLILTKLLPIKWQKELTRKNRIVKSEIFPTQETIFNVSFVKKFISIPCSFLQ